MTNTNHIYNATCNNIYLSFFQNSLAGDVPITPHSATPHSATLHVGLKSGVLSELPCRRRPYNPTFRCAPCGAEIFCPFRAFA
ncbi:hypothetical protein Barb4_00283 [Bacteroidales bacterium Barb4]|nr:hypothetical protein Barb4_00283 [Bacteroidales bacterium Barb4]